MSGVTAQIILPNFEKQFRAGITKEIKKIFKKRMPRVAQRAKPKLAKALKESIIASNTYQELLSGDLKGEVGLVNTVGLEVILDTWANGIEVKFDENRSRYGGFSIGMIRSDYADVLSLPEASIVYGTKKGSAVIDWLRWLLLESTSIIVSGYDFEQSDRGRTGMGIMVQKSGGGWSVPSEHAGTATDNFVTRSLEDIDKAIETVMREEINKEF